jgi:hypothetical protein
MGRARRRAVVVTSVVCLGAGALGACGSAGQPGDSVATVTAAGRSSAAVPPAASPGSATPRATASGPEAAPTSPAAQPSTTSAPPPGPRLRISHRVVTDGARPGLELPVFIVQALTDDPVVGRAARELQQALETQVATVAADWESAAEPGSRPEGGILTEQVSVPVNEAELVVVAWRASVHTGGAHPLTVLRQVTVDVAHGRPVTDAGLLGQLQQAGGPAWDFERELRRAVSRQHPDVPEAATLTRDELHVHPTRAGLRVTGDRCVLPCALPALEVTIPWDRLVGPDDDIEALPDAWGL